MQRFSNIYNLKFRRRFRQTNRGPVVHWLLPVIALAGYSGYLPRKLFDDSYLMKESGHSGTFGMVVKRRCSSKAVHSHTSNHRVEDTKSK